jgi:hypothetical protein
MEGAMISDSLHHSRLNGVHWKSTIRKYVLANHSKGGAEYHKIHDIRTKSAFIKDRGFLS